jgi:hypothetical protein
MRSTSAVISHQGSCSFQIDPRLQTLFVEQVTLFLIGHLQKPRGGLADEVAQQQRRLYTTWRHWYRWLHKRYAVRGKI